MSELDFEAEYRSRQQAEIQRDAELERGCTAALKSFAREHAEALRWMWRFGDGFGARVVEVIATEIDVPLRWERQAQVYQKAVIGACLRKEVMERDAYRCVRCGGHVDLCCDHIIPESIGGPTTVGNLQTMCRSCNSKKGARA